MKQKKKEPTTISPVAEIEEKRKKEGLLTGEGKKDVPPVIESRKFPRF